MTEHRIRLRGGWVCRAADSQGSPERRLTLPVQWDLDQPRRLTLTRAFGRPRLDRDRDSVLLQMDQVEGILFMSLNGQPVAPVSAHTGHYEIALGDLFERNTLVLEIEAPISNREPSASRPEWGIIALVVRTVEPPQNP